MGSQGLNMSTGDFVRLVAEGVFVDKTLLIKDILNHKAGALLITRPRRWGKTLNMSMLYHFLRCEVRENAATHTFAKSSPHQGLFDNLKIGKEYPELITEHQGKWPVISLTFKDIVGDDIRTVEQNFKDVFAILYSKYGYLDDWLCSLEKKSTTTAKHKHFCDVLEGKVDLATLQKSLYFLTELLYEYHDQTIFVLLDEYDAPLNNTCFEPTLYKKVLSFMRGLLGKCFKDNPYLEKGIMTGILRVAKADLFSGINNFQEYALLDEEYAEHFGFTDAEVSDLFGQPYVKELIETPTPSLEAIKAWYNGYTIGGITIYNPWSIMSCINKRGRLAPYWVNTGSDTLLRNLLQDSDDLIYQVEQLLAKDTLKVKISPHINMLDMDHDLKFWSLMLAAGYVTLAGEMPKQSSIKLFCQVRIPNMEIRATYEDLIIGWFQGQAKSTYYTNMTGYLCQGDVESFSKMLNSYLAEATSLRNIGPSGAERFYSGFMAGLFITLQKDFAINSEVESGQGYADMLIIPRKEHSKMAIVLEYKVAGSQEALAGRVREALEQIDQKAYVARVKLYQHIEEIVKVGVAFCGKEAAVEKEIVKIRRELG